MRRAWIAPAATAVAGVALMTSSCAARRTASAAPAGRTAVEAAVARQVRNAADAGDGDAYVRGLRLRLVQEPDNPEIRWELARHFRAAGAPELALEHCRLALDRSPGHAGLQLLQAQLLNELGEGRAAADGLERFLAAHPQPRAEFASWLGIFWDGVREFTRAEAAHRQALALAPSSDALHNNLGYNLLLQGRKQEAAGEFRVALRLSPFSEVARNNLGIAVAGEPRDAITLWQSGSDPASAHSNMAALLIEEGRFDEARKEIAIALGYNKSHPAALSNLALVSRLDGKPAEMPAAAKRPGRLRAVLRWVLGG